MIARHLAMSGRRYDVKDNLGSIRAVVGPGRAGHRDRPAVPVTAKVAQTRDDSLSSAFGSVNLGGSMWPPDAGPVRHGGTPVIGFLPPSGRRHPAQNVHTGQADRSGRR